MSIQTTLCLSLIVILIALQSPAQSTDRINGPLGVYHISAGYAYHDTTGSDSVLMQYEFRFGELFIPNQRFDNGFDFVPQLDSCAQWHANRVFGIIQPPAEYGAYDQPSDTGLYAPYAQTDGPGMIQGGERFSKLSQLYGGYSGVILDDWNKDTSITRQVRDAMLGKYANASDEYHAATPYNKLFGVLYSTNAVPEAMSMIDGVCYSYASTQNCCHSNLDSDINVLRNNFPHKEIMIATFLRNSLVGWEDPAGVRYMIQHSLDRYDDGDINAVIIFAGVYLIKPNISLSHWDSLALPAWLDSVYYPYLGEGLGKAYDCNTGEVLPDVSIRVFCKGRLSGDTLMRSYQKTDAAGRYQVGLWAGNRNTDSTDYWLIAEKPGYVTDTVGFRIKRGDTTNIPNIMLCAGANGSTPEIQTFPNPIQSKCTIVLNDAKLFSQVIDIYDQTGRRVAQYQNPNGAMEIDMSGWAVGIYILRAGSNVRKLVKE